jgi:hypothetical protein
MAFLAQVRRRKMAMVIGKDKKRYIFYCIFLFLVCFYVFEIVGVLCLLIKSFTNLNI